MPFPESSELSLNDLLTNYTQFLLWSLLLEDGVILATHQNRPHILGKKQHYDVRSTFPKETIDWIRVTATAFEETLGELSDLVVSHYTTQLSTQRRTNPVIRHKAFRDSVCLAVEDIVLLFYQQHDIRFLFGLWLALEASGTAGFRTVMYDFVGAFYGLTKGRSAPFSETFVAKYGASGANHPSFDSISYCPFDRWCYVFYYQLIAAVEQLGPQQFLVTSKYQQKFDDELSDYLGDEVTLTLELVVKQQLLKADINVDALTEEAELRLGIDSRDETTNDEPPTN